MEFLGASVADVNDFPGIEVVLGRNIHVFKIRLGLFWHFLDIAWVGIFSIVYLPGLL